MIGSWASFATNVSGVKVLRTLRVLRPLKSIKSYPALARMVTSVFHVVYQLQSFMVIFSFYILLFSILGLQLFSGPYLHARCRLTPYPVNSSWVPGLNHSLYRCIPGPNFDYPEQHAGLTKESSPWFGGVENCYWPLSPDEEDSYMLCSLTGLGTHRCVHDITAIW